MSVSPETAPEDVDPTVPSDTPPEAGDEAQTDIETGEPARGTDPGR
ncbi:MAG TPA: hypothetical protein VNB94_10925 [Mycobacteriales bacterium]|nr:hypothetical protein [Mycobacteriales bacterium]